MKFENDNQLMQNHVRNSSVELLKIIGIMLIVINHVAGTLTNMDTTPYCLGTATRDIQYLMLNMLKYGGNLGNYIFFVSSAWFLLDSDKINKRKILQMIMDIWVISVIILIVVYILRDGNIGIKEIIKNIFPTTCGNSWYMTCYLLFYPIHCFLNMVINNTEKATLLKTILVMILLYFGINYLKYGYFFSSILILWICIYFVIGYMKLYLTDISNNIKINIALFVVGLVGNIGMTVVTNILGLHIGFFGDKLIHWTSACSLFIILMVIGMFNIARNVHIESKIINYISKLSMLIYIIHENVLLRAYYRPMMWEYVWGNFGYEHILLWVFVLGAIVFVFGLISSIIYKCTIQKCVTKIGDMIYPKLCNGYGRIESILLKLH